MKAMSLFNGKGGAWIALERAGIKVTKRYSSEVDKYANIVSNYNWPDQINLGDVRFIDGKEFEIDILLAGSPCQSFSFAGKRNGMSTTEGELILNLDRYMELKSEGFEFQGESYLFWEFVRILKETKSEYFFLENVEMSKEWEDVISRVLGVQPLKFNSDLVSAQTRARLYWTNIGVVSDMFGNMIPGILPPKDIKLKLIDIYEPEVDEKYFIKNPKAGFIGMKLHEKGKTLRVGGKGSQTKKHNFDIICVSQRGRNPLNPKSRKSVEPTEQFFEPKYGGKSNCLTTVQKDNYLLIGDYRNDEGYRWRKNGKSPTLCARAREDGSGQPIMYDGYRLRRLTPIEYCRLQTIDDNYFIGSDGKYLVSESQIYKICGNGWTIDMVSYILKHINS
jgi:site-specific DNA-cytosine methylase